MQVLGDFICWDRDGGRYKDYADYVGFPVSERGKLSLKDELDRALHMAQIAINSVDGYTQQFNIELKVAELAEGEAKHIVQIYAACAILAFDSAISGLLSNDAKKSSENFLFAKGCVEIVNEYMDDWYPHKETLDRLGKNAISKMARENALKRFEKDPISKAKNDAKEAIKVEWSTIPKSKKTHGWKAQFANRMQTKFPVIEDVGTIKDWVREWEKTLPS